MTRIPDEAVYAAEVKVPHSWGINMDGEALDAINDMLEAALPHLIPEAYAESEHLRQEDTRLRDRIAVLEGREVVWREMEAKYAAALSRISELEELTHDALSGGIQ